MPERYIDVANRRCVRWWYHALLIGWVWGMQLAKSFSPKLLRQWLQFGVPNGRSFQPECHQDLLAAFSADVRCFQSLQRSFFTAACHQTPVEDTERTGKSFYVDRIRVEVLAGNGGSGCVAFWKSAAKGKVAKPPRANSL